MVSKEINLSGITNLLNYQNIKKSMIMIIQIYHTGLKITRTSSLVRGLVGNLKKEQRSKGYEGVNRDAQFDRILIEIPSWSCCSFLNKK